MWLRIVLNFVFNEFIKVGATSMHIMAENDEAISSICHIWYTDVIDDVA
jgi:hypothetical protein